MANGDDRTAQEIRESRGEESVLNAYTSQLLGTEQPGLTREQRGEEGYAEPDMSMYDDEDHEAWYADDSEDDTPVDDYDSGPVLDQGAFNDALHNWATGWTQQQQRANDPNAAALDIVDRRIEERLAGLQQAQESASQYQTERDELAEIRSIQEEMNAQDEGTAIAEQIAQQTAQYHALPPSDPQMILQEADALFNEISLQYLNNGGSPAGWEDVKNEYAQRCVAEAAIRLGRQTISTNALKRI
jgi:hypothetical protein